MGEEQVKAVEKLSVSAMIGLIIGIIGLLLSAVPIINNFAAVLAIIGLIFGILGLVKVLKGVRRGKGLAIAAIIVSALALVVVLASKSFYGKVLDDASKEANKSMDRATGAATDEILGEDVDVTLGSFSADTDQYGLTTTKLPVKVTNKLGEVKSYTIKIEAVDASGNRVVDDTLYVDKLGANQSQDLEAFKYVDSAKLDAVKSATFKIASVSEM